MGQCPKVGQTFFILYTCGSSIEEKGLFVNSPYISYQDLSKP